MKNEMNWITLWILMSSVIALLSLIYFYLNHELATYGMMVLMISSVSIVLPYSVWKYKQIRFVERRSIVIQILKD